MIRRLDDTGRRALPEHHVEFIGSSATSETSAATPLRNRFRWVALTDGSEWRIYNAHAPVPVEQKLFRSVRLSEDIDQAAEVLALLGRDDLRDNRIQELWKSYFVDRQVRRALTTFFGGQEPPRELVNLILALEHTKS